MAQDGNGNGTRDPSSAARSGASSVVVGGQVVGIAKLLETYGVDPLTAYGAALAYGYVAGAVGKVARDVLHEHETGVVELTGLGRIVWNVLAVIG